MKNNSITPEQIDALLPQTQCGECSYKGCLPYANAIIKNNEKLNRCIPGGITTLKNLGDLLQQNIDPLIDELTQQQKPKVLAKIIEDQCIGCTKCIQACPVDAIIGTTKQMHTVITQECTGCGLCVEPCPVDCIEMYAVTEHHYNPDKARARYQLREQRLINLKQEKINKYASATFKSQAVKQEDKLAEKRRLIQEAVNRSTEKRRKSP